MKYLQGVQGGYKTPTRGRRLVQVPYKGMRKVQDTYNRYKAGIRPHLWYNKAGMNHLQWV